MAKTKTVRVTEEELTALQLLREAKNSPEVVETKEEAATKSAQEMLVEAFVTAVERTKAPEKKNEFNRKGRTPWSPPDGVPRLKLRRKMYQHGLLIDNKVTNEDIALLNQIKPGRYCDGNVHVNLRKDKGLDITYQVRTASQRLKLVNNYGITSFTGLLQRIIDEKTNPDKYRKTDDSDLYDAEA